MANRYWVGGDGTWDGSSTSHWSASSGGSSGASVPTSSDAVIIDFNSGSFSAGITIGAGYTAQCLSIDWSTANAAANIFLDGDSLSTISVFGNVTGAQSQGSGFNVNTNFQIGANCIFSSTDNYSSTFTFTNTLTFTLANYAQLPASSFNSVTIVFNGNTLLLYNSGGISLGSATLTMGTGTLVISTVTATTDHFTSISAANGIIELTNSGGLNVSSMPSAPTIGTLTLHSDAGTFTGPATITTLNLQGGTFNGSGSTITTLYGGSAPSQSNSGGSFTITGNNSIGTFDVETTGLMAGIAMTMAAGQTQTITTMSGLTLLGAVGNTLTINSTSSGSQANFSMATGTVVGTYLSLKDNNATGGATFYYDSNSIIVSDVTGWNSQGPPFANAMTMRMM